MCGKMGAQPLTAATRVLCNGCSTKRPMCPTTGSWSGFFCLTSLPGGYWRGAGLGLAGGTAGVRVWSAGAGMLMVLSGAWAC